MMTHELKTWPGAFQSILDGDKRAEFRRDDGRGFRVGDQLLLREWAPSLTYTGRELTVVVTHILEHGQFGIPHGFVLMSIAGVCETKTSAIKGIGNTASPEYEYWTQTRPVGECWHHNPSWVSTNSDPGDYRFIPPPPPVDIWDPSSFTEPHASVAFVKWWSDVQDHVHGLISQCERSESVARQRIEQEIISARALIATEGGLGSGGLGTRSWEAGELAGLERASACLMRTSGQPGEARIYIASKSKHGKRWRKLRESGIPITSTWIDESEDGATSDWEDLWNRCLREASTATAFVMYVEPGEIHKGSMVELGVALHAGVPIYWVGPEIGSVWRARGVGIYETIDGAIEDIERHRRVDQKLELMTDAERVAFDRACLAVLRSQPSDMPDGLKRPCPPSPGVPESVDDFCVDWDGESVCCDPNNGAW